MIDTATKHKLLLDYNRKRKDKFEGYMAAKHGTKEEFYKTQEQHKKKRLEEDEDYTNLYKKLADDHENKDVRKKVVGKLTRTKESQISPTLGLNFNPAYRMEKNNQTTTF